MIAICKSGFRMPRGSVTSRANKPLEDERFVHSGDVLKVASDTQLIGEKSRKFDISTVKDRFLFMDEAPKCVWCALGIPRGGQRANSRQHAVGEREGAGVIFMMDCDAL